MQKCLEIASKTSAFYRFYASLGSRRNEPWWSPTSPKSTVAAGSRLQHVGITYTSSVPTFDEAMLDDMSFATIPTLVPAAQLRDSCRRRRTRHHRGMAGSGTIAIEASLITRGDPAWVPLRSTACDRMESFSSHSNGQARSLFADTKSLVIAHGIDRVSAAPCKEHMRRADAVPVVRCDQGEVGDLDPQSVLRSCASQGMGCGMPT